MKALVLGSGAREHALAKKIGESSRCERVFCHPGNAGLFRDRIEKANLPRAAGAVEVARFCQENAIELAVVGPETLLGQGYADELRRAGVRVVGPNSSAARLETSKLFAKEFMGEFGIPTAPHMVVHSWEELTGFTLSRFPLVLKYDGLAAGKGVVIASSAADIVAFAQRVFKDAEFGKPPHTILIEDFVDGTEISYIGLCDGECFVALESATDYKRIFDDGEGPNTGGMGAVSPSPFLTSDLKAVIEETIVAPIVRGLKTRKLAYNGALFIGLMISRGRPLVLEFNVRFGDPETQAILMRLESDLVDLLWATADGKLSALPPPLWSKDMSVYVVATAEGYPGKPTGGDTIQGLESTLHSSQLFSAGIDKLGDSWVTGGGRILGVGAKAATVASAREIAYKSLSNIGWRGMHFRTDIGKGI